MNEIERLRRALQLARPYVRLAAERPPNNANDRRKRDEAVERLRVVEAVLAATDGVGVVDHQVKRPSDADASKDRP